MTRVGAISQRQVAFTLLQIQKYTPPLLSPSHLSNTEYISLVYLEYKLQILITLWHHNSHYQCLLKTLHCLIINYQSKEQMKSKGLLYSKIRQMQYIFKAADVQCEQTAYFLCDKVSHAKGCASWIVCRHTVMSTSLRASTCVLS